MNRYQRRQLITSVLLLVLIAGCVGVGIFLRNSTAAARRTQEKNRLTAKLSEDVIQADRELALERYRNDTADEPAQVVTQTGNSAAQKAALLFYGVCSEEAGEELLAVLKQTNMDAALFLTAAEAADNQGLVTGFVDAGYEVGVLNDGTSRSISAASASSLVENLALAGTTIQSYYGIHPTSILMLDPVEGELPYAAAAAFYDQIYMASKTVNPAQLTTQKAADTLVSELNRGQLLAVKLSGGGKGTARGVEYLINAMGSTNLGSQAGVLLSQSGAQAGQTVKQIHTIQRAVSFTFSGMGSRAELNGVLDAMSNLGGRGIFFLSCEDLEDYEDEARQILEQGHTLGLLAPNTGTAEEILEQMLAGEELLRQRLNVTGIIPVQSVLGAPGEELLSAAEAGGFPVVSYDLLATRQEDVRQVDAQAVLEDLLPEQNGVLRRGEIVHFFLGLYQNSDAMLGKLVSAVGTQRNIYDICPATEILSNTEDLYEYPLSGGDILPKVRDKIHPGQLADTNIATLASRYIGADWVDRSSYLPGFTNAEVRLLDKTGLIPNAGNRIFLTFDDWGTDETLTNLLDVLAKHNVKATFFVRTHAVEGNPNLLRAIAAEGHAIGSHTHTHYALSNDTGSGRKYTDLTAEQVAELQQDLVTSYDTLQSIIGDIQVDGQPALCRIFRPPTLAMSRSGLETVLDCGFTYSVSGSFSTQDYAAKSAAEVFNKLKANTKDGAVLIMHMSDNSKYTAEAVDMYLTYLETSTKSYKVCRLTDVLDG